MNDFSLVRHLLEAAKERRVEIRTMGPTSVVSTEGQLAASEFDTRVDAMNVWCRSVEKLLIAKRFDAMRVHAGFERMSRIAPVLKRYRVIAARAQSVTVYGIDDFDPQTAGLRIKPLTGGPLANEWFVAVKANGFGAVVAAEDLDGFGGGTKLGDRRFRGIVTHNPHLVDSAMSALDNFAR